MSAERNDGARDFIWTRPTGRSHSASKSVPPTLWEFTHLPVMAASTRLSDQYGAEPGLVCILVTVSLVCTNQAEHAGASAMSMSPCRPSSSPSIDREAALAAEVRLYPRVGDSLLRNPTSCAAVHVGNTTPATPQTVTVRVLFLAIHFAWDFLHPYDRGNSHKHRSCGLLTPAHVGTRSTSPHESCDTHAQPRSAHQSLCLAIGRISWSSPSSGSTFNMPTSSAG
jgi:hypothetical protein